MDLDKCTGNKIHITKVNGSKVLKLVKAKSIKMVKSYKKVYIKMENLKIDLKTMIILINYNRYMLIKRK